MSGLVKAVIWFGGIGLAVYGSIILQLHIDDWRWWAQAFIFPAGIILGKLHSQIVRSWDFRVE